MTTLSTTPSSANIMALQQAAALLENQAEVLQTAVHATLRQHIFHNHGRLMTPRPLPGASQEIIQSYLQSLRTTDPGAFTAPNNKLVAQGLGHISALAVADTLYETTLTLLQQTDISVAEVTPILQAYRRYFLHQYMLTREQTTITARENLYQNVEAALEKQIGQERDLRHELEEQRSQLTQERALLNSLLDSIPDLIFYKDINSVYLGCNDAFAEFAGRAETDLIGKTDFDLFPHDVATFFREQDVEMMTQQQARQNEEWVDYPDGRRVLLDTLKTPFYDVNKNLLGLIGISRDITASYESQVEQIRLSYVIEQSLDGTAVANLDGIIEFVNPVWAAMHGYTPDELIGQHLSIFHTPEQIAQEVDPVNQQAISSGQPQRAEIGHIRKDGSTFPTMMTIGLLKGSDDSPIGLVASVQDISEQKAATAALRENQARLAQANQVIESSPAILFRWRADEHWSVEYVSENVARFGYTPEELLTGQTPYASLVHPDDLERVAQEVGGYSASGVAQFTQEYRVITKDGQVRWTDDRTHIIRSETGEITHYQGIVIDITERKLAEAALRENQARLAQANQVIESSPAILFRWRADEHWSVEYVSENVARFGYTPEELLTGQTPYASMVHPDDLERVAQEVGDYSASGVAQFTQEYRVITKDGQIRWTDDRTHIIRSETGEITHYQGIVIDITERKLAEAAMRESETRLKSLVNNVPGTIYRCALDADYTMEVISDDIIHLSGYPAADFIGNQVRSYASIIYEEDRELVDTVILEGVQNETSYNIEYRICHADGRLIWIGERGQAIYDENGAARWLDGVLLDITGQKEAEAALAKRAREMQAVFEVSNAIATILDPTSLLQEVADRTKANFNLYHTHIYLLDETGSILKLAAGAGDVGREMVAQDWQIPISRTNSVVARVARNKAGAIVNDVRNEPGFLFNEMLPDTRAELAVPLLIGEQLLGVLDVQANTPDYFSADDVIIQTSLAAQVSVAIQNARSFVTSEAARQELSLLTRRLTHEGWQSYLTQQTTPQINVTYGQDLGNDTPLQQALTIQGESIGHMTIGRPQALEADATEILTAVAERLSSHVENLRLTAQTEAALSQTEQQAERLSLLNEMGSALSRANTLADIYQAAARYTGQILDGDSTSLALLNPAGDSLTLIALEGIEAGNIIGENLPLAGTAIARALHEQRSLIAPQDFPLGDSTLAAEGIQSFICAPLLTSDRPLGALNVGSKKANAYDRTDTYLVQQVVSLLAATLESRRLFEETRRRAERETLLNVISQKIQNAPTIESALQTAITELGQALKFKQIQVRLNIDKKENGHTEHAATEERYHG